MEWLHKELDEQIELMHEEMQALEEEGKRMKCNNFQVSIEKFEKYEKARYYLLSCIKLAHELKNVAQ